MDPITVKFIQLIAVEILRAALLLAGVLLFLRGVAGKSTLIIEGLGLKTKLINAAPGGLVLIVGIVVLALSLHSTVERTERAPSASDTTERWLANSYQVTESMA